EQKALGPRGNVNAASLEGDGVTLGRERPPQRLRRVETRSVLIEAHETQGIRTLDDAGVRRQRARQRVEQRRFAAPVRAEQADTRARCDREIEVTKEQPAAERLAHAARNEEASRSSLRRRELDPRRPHGATRPRVLQLVDETAGFLDAPLRFRGAGFGAATEPR